MANYQLSYGKAHATVKEVGGELASYVGGNGIEYIWGGDPAVWGGHSPVLFPVVGSTKDGKVTIGKTSYEIPKHGFVRKCKFTLAKHGADFVEYTYASNSDTLAQYPFEFVLHITHSITEAGFTTTFLVENCSGKEMPVCIGGHPGFNCPLYPNEAFEDYIVRFSCEEDGENTLAPNGGCITGVETLAELDGDTLPLRHALFDPRDALIFAKPNSRSVKLLNAKTGRGIEFDFHKFDALGIWSAPGKNAPYVCLEPWSGLPAYENETGAFEDKPYVKWIKAGECYRTGYTMTIIE